MADNLTLNSGAGGATLATDDVSGVHYQIVKISTGALDDGGFPVSSTNPMPVGDAGGSLTVDNGGTFAVQAAQSGAWNITNVSGTVSLPTGAATAAKQPALGVAGTASADVITVQGIAAMTALKVDGSAVTQPVSNAALSTTGGGVEAGALRVTLANDSTGVVSVDDNGGSLTVDNAALSVTGGGVEAGALRVTLANDSTGVVSVDDNGGSLTVDGSVTCNAGTNLNTSALALESGGNLATIAGAVKAEDSATADTHTGFPALAVQRATPVNTAGTDGDYEFLQMSGGRLWTSATIDTALPAGTNAIGKLASNIGVTIGAVEIAASQTLTTLTGGATAHDSADAGNPHKIGAKAETALSGVTLVADGDRTDLYAGIDGVLITRPHCNLEDIVTGNASNTDGSSTQCIAAQAAGIKTYLTSVILTNTSSSNIYCEIKDGTTAKVTIPVPANGGAVFNPPVPLPGTAATAWNFDPSSAATTVYCSMIGFKSKV
jgi:hypothetical protein